MVMPNLPHRRPQQQCDKHNREHETPNLLLFRHLEPLSKDPSYCLVSLAQKCIFGHAALTIRLD
jgi:hypothetical protein